MKRRRIIGLTGLYCAGKSHIADLLAGRGFDILDADKLGHGVLEQEKDVIAARFGPSAIGEDGKVDRKALGALVFGKPDELAALENIVHPGVNRITNEWMNADTDVPGLIHAALLHRSSAFSSLDFIILVKAPFLTRLLRARKRDRLPWKEILRRFKSQGKFLAQYLSGNADIYTVHNNGYFSLCSRFNRKRVERRIDVILSREGMVR